MLMLIELAQNDVSKEEQRLGKLLSEQIKASDQLLALKQYREDYSERLLNKPSGDVGG